MLSNEYTNQLQVSRGTYLLPFSNDRKVIFEGNVKLFHSFRYEILAYVLGGLTLYFLWQGDAKYKTIILVPAVALGAFVLAKRNSVRNSFTFVKEITLHKDGSKVDIVTQLDKSFKKFEGVPVNSLKYITKDINIPTPSSETDYLNTSDIRLLGVDGNILQFGENYAFVPVEYSANELILKQLYNGQTVKPEYL